MFRSAWRRVNFIRPWSVRNGCRQEHAGYVSSQACLRTFGQSLSVMRNIAAAGPSRGGPCWSPACPSATRRVEPDGRGSVASVGSFTTRRPMTGAAQLDPRGIDDALDRAGVPRLYRHRFPLHALSWRRAGPGPTLPSHLPPLHATLHSWILNRALRLDIGPPPQPDASPADECACGRAVVAAVHDLDLASRFCKPDYRPGSRGVCRMGGRETSHAAWRAPVCSRV